MVSERGGSVRRLGEQIAISRRLAGRGGSGHANRLAQFFLHNVVKRGANLVTLALIGNADVRKRGW